MKFTVACIAIVRFTVIVTNFTNSAAFHGDDSRCRQFRIEFEHVGCSTASSAGCPKEIRSQARSHGPASQARNHPNHVNTLHTHVQEGKKTNCWKKMDWFVWYNRYYLTLIIIIVIFFFLIWACAWLWWCHVYSHLRIALAHVPLSNEKFYFLFFTQTFWSHLTHLTANKTNKEENKEKEKLVFFFF